MKSDDSRLRTTSGTAGAADEIPGKVRGRILDVAADMQRAQEGAGQAVSNPDASRDVRPATEPADRAAVDLYLALLQDRLPVYARTVADLTAGVGHRSVHDNLLVVARATIDFYCEILAVKVSVFTRPAQLVRLRAAMRDRQLGPQLAPEWVAGYLRQEQELGRIAPDVGPLTTARLLVGACMSYAFTRMLMGEDEVPPRDQYVADVVSGLRLQP